LIDNHIEHSDLNPSDSCASQTMCSTSNIDANQDLKASVNIHTHMTVLSANTDSILRSIGELVYAWDLRYDRINWNGDAVGVLQATSLGQIATGAAFQQMMNESASSQRHNAIFNSNKVDTGSGVTFNLCYAIEPSPNRIIWVEDRGCWFADRNGAPYLVHGSIRLASAPAIKSISDIAGILGRDSFKSVVESELAIAKIKHQQTAIVMVGINNLGHINRTYGFELADDAVAIMAVRLKGTLRAGDEIGRYSGNKFALLLNNCSEAELNAMVPRMLDVARNGAIETRQGSITVSLKIGATHSPRDGTSASDLLQCAEQALASVKKRHDLNYICLSHNQHDNDQHIANQKASDEILHGLNERRIILAFQPIACANTRKIKSYEGLVRMRQLDGRIAGAGQIIPPAERVGLLKHIDMRVVELAVDALAKDSKSKLSINVDVPSLMSSDWMENLSSSLFNKRVEASRLIVEITETAMIKDLAATTNAIHKLHEMGVQVALDDFGAGHTSFKTLRNMPINIVKIDGVFITNLKNSRDDRFFVKTLVNLACHLGMKTVAEWVQDAETADVLQDIGIDYLQGDFVGEALVENDIYQSQNSHFKDLVA
jgi:diguanylate cyclase (GGDEF)-like protein